MKIVQTESEIGGKINLFQITQSRKLNHLRDQTTLPYQSSTDNKEEVQSFPFAQKPKGDKHLSGDVTRISIRVVQFDIDLHSYFTDRLSYGRNRSRSLPG